MGSETPQESDKANNKAASGTASAGNSPKHVKPVLKHPDEKKHKTTDANENDKNDDEQHQDQDKHLKWNEAAIPVVVHDPGHESDEEFREHRKQHYNEMEEVRKFRHEHPNLNDEDDGDAEAEEEEDVTILDKSISNSGQTPVET